MGDFELLLQINEKTKQNINKLNEIGKIPDLSKCITFTEDLGKWLSFCGDFSDYLLVKEAQTEFVHSIYFCAQGFYKKAILTLRQCLEHILFSILLSINDYNYRLWKAGSYDMSWSQIISAQNGIFSKQYIRMYSPDLDEEKSIELLTIAKTVYRECSEFIHGNYNKLLILSQEIEFHQDSFDRYIEYFNSIQYVISMSFFIRFRDILNDSNTMNQLESILQDNLGTVPEIQLLFNQEGEEENE